MPRRKVLITRHFGLDQRLDNCCWLVKRVFFHTSSAGSRKSDNETHLLHMSWYVYLWYIWWFLLRIFGGIFWGNFLTCNLLTIAHNARWRHFLQSEFSRNSLISIYRFPVWTFFCDRLHFKRYKIFNWTLAWKTKTLGKQCKMCAVHCRLCTVRTLIAKKCSIRMFMKS